MVSTPEDAWHPVSALMTRGTRGGGKSNSRPTEQSDTPSVGLVEPVYGSDMGQVG